MSFDKCTQLCNHHHSEDTDYSHLPSKIPLLPLVVALPRPQPLPTTGPFSFSKVLSYSQCHINKIIWYVTI